MALIEQLAFYESNGTNEQVVNKILFETGGEAEYYGLGGSGISCVVAKNLPGLYPSINYLIISFGQGDYNGQLDMQTLMDDNIAQYVHNIGDVLDFSNVQNGNNSYQKTVQRANGESVEIKAGNIAVLSLSLLIGKDEFEYASDLQLEFNMKNMGGQAETMIEVSIIYPSQNNNKIVLFEIKNDNEWSAPVYYGLDNSGVCRYKGYIAGSYEDFDDSDFYDYFTNGSNNVEVSLTLDTTSFVDVQTEWWQTLILNLYPNNRDPVTNILYLDNIDGFNLATGFGHPQTLILKNFGRFFKPITPRSTACFTENAVVKTDQGLFKIKDMSTKHTIDNKSIKGISNTTYTQDKLVAIEKDALGKNKPDKKTLVAPFHRFLFNNSLKAAIELVNNDSIYLTKYNQETLYNIILETHETIQVNNVVAETLDPSTLVAKLFDGSLPNKQRNKLIKSLNAYHENLKNKPNKTIKDYQV